MPKYFLLTIIIFALAACEPEADQGVAQDTAAVESPVPPHPIMEGSAEPALITEHTNVPSADNTHALLVDGQPVSALCFIPFLLEEETQKTLKLSSDCTGKYAKTSKGYIPIEGYTGSSFITVEMPDAEGMAPAFIAYRVVGTAGDKLAIQAIGSGGGSGIFSTLFTGTRSGNTLTVDDAIAGGDRCNGGLQEASMDANGTLSYSINITPYDFVTIETGAEIDGLDAYSDLDACAACCFAEAHYTDKKLDRLTLHPDNNPVQQPSDLPTQICFDTIMSKQTKTDWTLEEYRPLREQIIKECATHE